MRVAKKRGLVHHQTREDSGVNPYVATAYSCPKAMAAGSAKAPWSVFQIAEILD
jgi:hypothetical protein